MSWFHKKWARLVVVAILLFDLFLFVAHVKNPQNRHWLDRALLWITAPVQDAFVFLIDGAVGIWTGYVDLVGLKEQNQDLQKQVDGLQRTLVRMEAIEAENLRLRELVNMSKRLDQHRLVGARVIGFSISPVSRVIRINVGRKQGVEAGLAVVDGHGLVGKIQSVTEGYSDVRLIVDGRNAVDVVIQRSRARGIVRGRGDDTTCSVDYLVRTSDVKLHDKVVTSGMGGIYPKGLLVGTISMVTSPAAGVFRQAELQPVVAFQKLEDVMVVLMPVSAEVEGKTL